MFVISLNYTSPLEQIDLLLEEHLEFLKEQYKERNFIASGGKIPRTGGVILALGNDKKTIESIIKKDPFYKEGVAEYEITEFTPKMTLPEFSSLKEG